MVTNEEMLEQMEQHCSNGSPRVGDRFTFGCEKKTTKKNAKTLHSGAPVSIFAKITVILSAVIFALSAQLLEAPVTFTFVALCAFRPTFLFRFWSVAKVCFLNAKLPSSDRECLERKNSQCPN